jgi:hypothetical protein
MWVIPNSEPSLTNFADAELRILNDRGYRYRPFSQARPVCAPENPTTPQTATTVVTKTLSNSPFPNKPFVKLPPHDANPDELIDLEDHESKATPPVQDSEQDFIAVPKNDLPGMKWTEEWKEKNGNQGSATDERPNINEEKKHPSSIQTGEACVPEVLPIPKSQVPDSSLSLKEHLQYKINIPAPSMIQMKTHRPISNSSANTYPHRKLPSQNPIKYVYQTPSTFSQTLFSQQNRSLSRSSSQSTPRIVTSIPKFRMERKVGGTIESVNTSHQPTERSNSMVEIVWESSMPDSFTFPGTPDDNLTHNYKAQSDIDIPPTFPFPQSTESEAFSFQPVLGQTSAVQFFGPSNPNSSHSTLVTDDVPYYAARLGRNSSKRSPHIRGQNNNPSCYEWNYYLKCPTTENEQCAKIHICEICASAEHRATQHWHHLATAPLPEIQAQPKLSTFAPPPESPTLSGLKERASHSIVNALAQRSDSTSLRFPQISSFVPPFRLDGSQRTAVQSERLKLRKRQTRPKFLTAPANDTLSPIATPYVPNKGIVLSQQVSQIPVATQTPALFEKPLEVILPPLVRPFQKKTDVNTTTAPEESSAVVSVSKGGLRVAAPEFKPTYAGAWIPFGGSTNQFSNLFRIPSRESGRIEIIAPEDKEKGNKMARKLRIERPESAEIPKEMRSDSAMRSTIEVKDVKPTAKKSIGSAKPEFWPSFSIFPLSESRGSDQVHHALSEPEWYMPGNPQTYNSKTYEKYSCLDSLPSDNLDRSVLQILDEQLDTIMGQASEETIATTLETIIEICSASPTATTPCCAKFQHSPNALDFESVSTDAPTSKDQHCNASPEKSSSDLPKSISPTSSSELPPPTTNQFFTLGDFADDDVVFSSLSDISTPLRGSKSHQGDDGIRPRTADSSSTAPLTPFGSPHTLIKLIDLDQRRPILLDHTPLKGRVEQMMSCATARGVGQCNCGLGDWFHHIST